LTIIIKEQKCRQ